MSNLNNFAAQQLTKKQMNKVKGGKYAPPQNEPLADSDILLLECHWADGRMTIITSAELDTIIASGGNCQAL